MRDTGKLELPGPPHPTSSNKLLVDTINLDVVHVRVGYRSPAVVEAVGHTGL